MTQPKPLADKERAALTRAVLRLPRTTRDVFLLSRFDGFDLVAISRHLGLPVEAIQAHLVDALLRLRRATDRIERARSGRASSE